MSHVTAIIAAAGQGSRMGSSKNKQFLPLLQKPVLAHTLSVFQECWLINDIIVVAASGEENFCCKLVKQFGFSKVIDVITGGQNRQDSVLRGLGRLSHECSLVAVHDGARPLLLLEHLVRVIKAAGETGGGILAVPVKDTLKMVDTEGMVAATPDRSGIWAVQTPQVFKKEIIVEAYRRAKEQGFSGTDDSFLVENCGFPVRVIQGSYSNIKITTPEDLELAEILLKRRKQFAGGDGI